MKIRKETCPILQKCYNYKQLVETATQPYNTYTGCFEQHARKFLRLSLQAKIMVVRVQE